MALVPVKNDDERGRDLLLPTGELVEHGATVLVPAEIAGKPAKGRPGEDRYEEGEGLLAQSSVWRPGKKSDADDAPRGDSEEGA